MVTKHEIALELTEGDVSSNILNAAVKVDPSQTRKEHALWAAEGSLAELGGNQELAEYVEHAYGLLKGNKI